MAYANYKLNKGVNIENKQKGGAYHKETDGQIEYVSLIDFADNTITTADTACSQQNATHQVPIQPAENVTSDTHSNLRANDSTDKERNSKIKYFVLLLIVIVIAAVSSAATAFILKQNLEDSLRTVTEAHFAQKGRISPDVWSPWAEWGDCSVTCNGSVRSRNRTCNRSGLDEVLDICSGNEFDICVCSNDDCNGIWSPWTIWGECSVTCNVGVRSRNRTCNDISQSGPPGLCFGNDLAISTCYNDECTHIARVTEGIWSYWASWGECSVTCNGGIRSRKRTCNGSDQDGVPGICSGNDVDISSCSNDHCPHGQADKPGPSDVSFSSYLTTTLTHVTKESPIVFDGVSNNAGNAYNSSSGVFKCPTAGTYLFSLTVLAYENKTAV